MVNNNKNVTENEGGIKFERNEAEDVLNKLNKYVEEHKNDYQVPLKEWKLVNVNGEMLPILDD